MNFIFTDTVVAVHELARLRAYAVPSHLRLNCAITCEIFKIYYIIKILYDRFCEKKKTYLAITETEEYSHAKALWKNKKIKF